MVEYLVEKKFHNLGCYISGVLLQHHTHSVSSVKQDVFSQMFVKANCKSKCWILYT